MKRALVLAGLLCIAACGGTNACKSDTVLLTLGFDVATASADDVDVTVTLDGVPAFHSLPRTDSRASDTVEIDFPAGYPAGKMLSVHVSAKQAGVVIGEGDASQTAGPTCTVMHVDVTGAVAMPDLTGVEDLSMTPDLVAETPDLATADDLALPAHCSNGVKDGNETDTDCGGADCAKCTSNKTCMTGTDCASGMCTTGYTCT